MNREKWNVGLFFAILAVFFLLNLFFRSTEDVSRTEQRTLKQWPDWTASSLLNGDYARDVEDYFADRFVFRSAFIGAGSSISALYGIDSGEEVSIQVSGGNNMHVIADSKRIGDDGAPQASGSGHENDGKKGRYLVIGNRAMEIYYYREQAAEKYAAAVNAFAAKAKGIKGVKGIYTLLVPSSIEYLNNDKYRKLSPSQSAAAEEMAKHLAPGVTNVPVYNQLQQHVDEYIYFRTDHHWTALGAYYGYVSFAKEAGKEALSVDDYEWQERGTFLGTTYAATMGEGMKDDPDKLFLYKAKEAALTAENMGKMVSMPIIDQYATGYSAFLGGDTSVAVMTTEHSGERILIIKDSYANAFAPFLIPHYEEIHLLDLRYYKGDVYDYMERNDIDDVLFLNNSAVTSHEGFTDVLEKRLGLNLANDKT
ncbi:DHHW family protein [Paenibacillus sp. J5C_2022]|uniref:DHHW family protein n=1 Tax=Paenibacillus sp. J5C2022 TaxID=2977129 RepID=UPI0021D36B34|nr:DHHW family protein [Paenibacillus sp. J5C2022]MCU6710348.1 DHHW family protein [Paenibacillus sp. J5C2022]